MALTRLDNLYSSKTGKYLYVSPDDYNATDELDNRGNSPLRPFKTIQRAFIEVARYSYVPGSGNDRFDQFSIMLMPGNHYIDNRPGLVDTNSSPEFSFDEVNNVWTDNSILDLSNSDNVLYKFNATTGGAIVPRGCSLVGYDLRRTIIRPLYVPDPVDKSTGRTSIFNLTGGCYLWQFTIKDGDLSENSPLYNTLEGIGKVYSQPEGTTASLKVPEYSHHKICIMEYAENKELDLYYEKVGQAFSKFQPTIVDDGELDPLVQENRIVGPLSDSRTIDSLRIDDIPGTSTAKVTVTTKIEHGYFEGQYVAVLNTDLDEELNGTFKIYLDSADPKVFSYTIDTLSAAVGLTSGNTYDATTAPNALGANAISLAEIDSVESASPYVFNCSIRSTWGQCGMWANGSKATGFRSMVVAQYTGVSLQKDDRAFIRYDRFTNTWNQASLNDAFATVPYHTKGDAYWKDDWRNFHIRASDDSFIQCVSVFAVGFFDHFLMESGGDMSITNSNSNFGNTSLHAVGHKGYAFNQDKGGYITDIIPPRVVSDSRALSEKIQYYTFDVLESNDAANHTKLYLGSDTATNPEDRPASTIGGYRIGAKADEKVYVRLDPQTAGGNTEFSSTLSPSGFKRYSASLSILNPPTIGNYLDNYAQDAANSINTNKEFIQNEAYAYIINKYPTLDPNDPSFKGGIDITKCKRDIGYIVDAVVTDLRLTLDTTSIPASYTDTSNINVIQAAEAYYVGGQLDYIENELTETLEAWDYVKNLCIAAMRNWDYLRGPVNGNPGCVITQGSSLIDVGDTTGLLVGMTVQEYTQNDFVNGKLNLGAVPILTNIPDGAFISEIVSSTQIRIANNNGELNASGSNGNAFLHFDLTAGYYDGTVLPISDDSITQDTAYPECGNISLLIQSYFDDIDTILGGGTVVRRESQINTTDLARRATVFTINTGGGQSDPHNFETGTPVRLVPRAKEGTNPDKRLIRLPLGFETNTKYYVIAPGRRTNPEDYSDTNDFNGGDSTKLMLATSPENAAAGNYIFSPETETIDTDVEIDIYQYVLDSQYDLHKYVCNVSASGNLETDVSHIFDLPVNGGIPQKVFFRAASDINGSSLPTISGGDVIDDQKFYYARYVKIDDGTTGNVPQKQFTIHPTFTDAINNTASVTFQPNSGSNFYVFCDKRESPLKFDPEKGDTGIWYLNVKDESSGLNAKTTSILYRMHLSDYDDASGKIRTTDSWFERISDNRSKEDRVYRFRYVIPNYLESVRDPLNGFVMKIRTDDKRRLVPQRLLLKPIGGATPVCELRNPSNTQEQLGLREDEYSSTITPSYDPYVNPVTIETESKIAFNVQSARKINVEGTDYLEITVFDHQIIDSSLKGKLFYALKITSPQGGSFIQNETASNASNFIEWTGNSSGNGYVQSVVEYVTGPDTSDWYMILKDVNGTIEYDQYNSTTFAQQGGSVTTTLAAKPDSIGDPDGKSKSLRDDYLYAIPRAGVYTAVPGDVIEVSIQGGGTAQYFIDYVQDVPEIDDTFYIFDIDELQERISGQQDGIYYLTAVRGNISPFPQGPGVGDNFKNFKFSQPISQLYPLDYKNDPLWFKSIDSTLLDPPATISAADNYVHGLVTVNDYKNSETKESTIDLLQNLGEIDNYEEGGKDFAIIAAQEGNATSGSEDRKIPIFGNQNTPSASKLYVELRRPSIARSGNHTFEYLGFGPGNYSTGFPLRQEVILSDKQDFYAQSKREDGGIVFYTGLNSNGDLYIGNRKINAITGEETFLEAATLESSDDDSDDLGSLVTTFETPVTFQDKITVEGDAFFNNPVEINVESDEGESLRIYSKISNTDDPTLSRSSFIDPRNGDIVLTKNRIDAAIFAFNPRGTVSFPGQRYTFRTHSVNNNPSNLTPNQKQTFNNNQLVKYGTTTTPTAGDVLFKGVEVNNSGSLAWIYANSYVEIDDANILNLQTDGSNLVRVNWNVGIANINIGVEPGDLVKLTGLSDTALNGIWEVQAEGYDVGNNFIDIKIQNNISQKTIVWGDQINVIFEVSDSNWKEVGVIGSESIRTETNTIGNYKVGINTVARSAHKEVFNAFVSSDTTPRANLDVVGNAFISGKSINSYLSETTSLKTETNLNNAFLVGGDSSDPDELATLRVMTANGGRLGVNTAIDDQVNPQNNLDKNFVVVGDARITGDTEFSSDIQVNGGDLTTTNNTFNFVPQNAKTLNWASQGQILNLMNNQTIPQTISIGNATNNQTISIGESVTKGTLNIFRNSDTARVDLATVSNLNSSVCEILVGGAWATQSDTNSYTKIGTFYTGVAGNLEIGTGWGAGTSSSRLYTQTRVANLFDGDQTNEVNFALNATDLSMGSTGGSTTVRNTLNVLASAVVEGNIRLDGGLNAGIVEIGRGKFGSTAIGHNVGGLQNPNIDFYKYESTGKFIDTGGVSAWGSNSFLLAGGQISSIDNIINSGAQFRPAGTYPFLTATSDGIGDGATFTVTVAFDGTLEISVESPGSGYVEDETLTITNDQLGGGTGGGNLTFQVNGTNDAGQAYILPITTPSVNDFQIGDLLLLDRGNADSPDEVGVAPNNITGLRNEAESEIVRIVGIANIANPSDPQGYRLIVNRGQEGTGTYSNHPDGCVIAKLVKQSNASYITGSDGDFDGNIDIPEVGIIAGTNPARIGIAEFGGSLSTLDYLRLSGSEFVSIIDLISTSPQSLSVNDGGSPAAEVFKVESTTGDTYIFGDILAGSGFNKFTVDSQTGNTNINGTLTTENTLTINGSTLKETQWFRITNGGPAGGVPLRTTLEVDTATGDLTINGGNINIYAPEPDINGDLVPRLTFDNSSGDFTTYGSLSAQGSGASTFGGSIKIFKGGLDITYRDSTADLIDRRLVIKDTNENELFSVEQDGGMTVASIPNYISRTGGRKWLASSETVINALPNVNYFVNPTGNTIFKLPQNPLIGDMIRIIDISGSLTFNLSLVVRAPDNVKVQGELSNTGSAVLVGVPPSAYAGYNGGELIVQTPNAAFGLVYAGAVDPDGNSSDVPSALTGWYLMDV